ncbi:MAG: thioredoxin family protein [Terrimicrobiaceae bacterium]
MCGALPRLGAQIVDGKTLVEARLVAGIEAIEAGVPFTVGLVLNMAPGWHTYWKSPGDAGLATQVNWQLPEGFSAGPLKWPVPRRVIEPGDIQVFAYKQQVVLLATIKPPAILPVGPVRIAAKATWLVCEQICIPGSATVELTLPQQAGAATTGADLIEKFRSRLPLSGPPPYGLQWSAANGDVELIVSGLPTGATVDYFADPADGQTVGHPVASPLANGTTAVKFSGMLPQRGLLVVDDAGKTTAWEVDSQTAGSASPAPRQPDGAVSPAASGGSLLQALMFGFLGGLILNLMPCVLPVISLKIFGFMKQAGEEPRKILAHGLAFTAGIFLWFLGLAAVIAALKMFGTNVTWAFQFQNPWFNLVISAIVFVFALNLFGVFEIVLPGRAANALSQASGGSGYAGSFFQGVFATLLATPCTAPFLGSALGFAFSQNAAVIFAMFASVSLGMAIPYLLLSAQPGWMKWLPKPGAWMERIRQFMGFPLLATLIWLLSVLGNQKGTEGLVWAMAFLLCLGLACWIYGSFCGPLSKPRLRWISLTLAAIIAVGGTVIFAGNLFANASRPATETGVNSEDSIPWVPFSEQSLQSLIAENRGVFVDFTAEWCITCKFNERTAIDRSAVREALAAANIVPMKADWTNSNPEITRALAAFGRVGVPFYVIYPAGRADEPIVLPELLTESIMLEAISRAR